MARKEVRERFHNLDNMLPLAVVEQYLDFTWEVTSKITDKYNEVGQLTDDLKYLIDLFSVIQGERLLFERDKNISYGDYIGDKKKGSKSIIRLHAMLKYVPSEDPDVINAYAKEWILALDKVMKMMIGMGIIDDLNLTRTVMVDLIYLMTTAYFLLEEGGR